MRLRANSVQPEGEPAAPTAPAAPDAVWVGQYSGTELAVAWDDYSLDETAFRVERSATGAGGWAVVGDAEADATGYLDGGLSRDTTYYYRVSSFNAAGQSQHSAAGDNRTLPPPPPAPTGLTAVAVLPRQVNLSWPAAATPPAEYVVERIDTRTSPWRTEPLAVVPGTSTSYQDLTVRGGRDYTYYLRARGPGGTSPYAAQAPASATTPLAAPTGLAVTSTYRHKMSEIGSQQSYVNLTWSDPSDDEDGFLIGLKANGSPSDYTLRLPANTTSWTYPWGDAGTPLYVRAFTTTSDSSPSFPSVPSVHKMSPASDPAIVPEVPAADPGHYTDQVWITGAAGADEGSTAQLFLNRRRVTADYGSSLTVALRPVMGTATAADVTVPETVTFPAGATTVPFTVGVNSDDTWELPEVAALSAAATDRYFWSDNYASALPYALTLNNTNAKVELIEDSNNDHYGNTNDALLQVARIGSWGEDYNFGTAAKPFRGVNGYNVDGKVFAGLGTPANQWENFIDRDPNRFYVRVTDGTKANNGNANETVTASIRTLKADGVTDEDKPTQVTLEETGGDTGIFVSKSQLLVSLDLDGVPPDMTDDGFSVSDGFTPDNPTTQVREGFVADEQLNDRTHQVSIDGTVRAEYGTASYDKLLFRTGWWDERRKVQMRVVVFNEHDFDFSDNGVIDTVLGSWQDAIEAVDAEVKRANAAWAQAGIKVERLGEILFENAPPLGDFSGNTVLDDLYFDGLNDERQLITHYKDRAPADVLQVFWVGPLLAPGGGEALGRALVPMYTSLPSNRLGAAGDKTFLVMSSEAARPNAPLVWDRPVPLHHRTLAHEIGHALTNLPDQPTPAHVFFPGTLSFGGDGSILRRRRLTSKTIEDARHFRLPATTNDELTNFLRKQSLGNMLLKKV